MKKKMVLLVVIVSVGFRSSFAVEVYDSNYKVETFLTYSHATQSAGGMCFDGNGNLYITYEAGGTIDKISADKSISTISTGFLAPRDIVWTGGTAYGDFLYVADHAGSGSGKIAKVNLNGSYTTFSSINSPQGIGIDRIGNYGGYLYTGPRVSDHIDKIHTNGTLEKFCDFPYNVPGGPTDVAFDPGTEYGGLMYVTVDGNNSWRGLSSVDKNGNPTRFATSLLDVGVIAFDTNGTFQNKLFSGSKINSSDPYDIWRINPDGSVFKFAHSTLTPYMQYAFSSDGVMYTHEAANNTITISRITPIPEPATFLLFVFGGLIIRRRKSKCLI